MGIVTSIRRSVIECFEEAEPPSTSPVYEIIDNDQKYIEHQSWHRQCQPLLFDYNKLVFYYHEYEVDQTIMDRQWENAGVRLGEQPSLVRDSKEVLSLKLKYAIRKGVPCSKLRMYASEIFNLNWQQQSDYDRILQVVFKGKMASEFVQVPLFGIDADNIRAALRVHCLNSEGIKALSRILWVINKTKTLQFCPMLVHVASLLLIFLSEKETFRVVEFLVDDSIALHLKNQETLRWHFTLNEGQFEKLARSCFEEVASISKTFKELTKHFQSKNIDKEELFKDMVSDFFFKYLPFAVSLVFTQFVYKIFVVYLNEGVKIFFRVFYSLLKHWKEDVLRCDTIDRLKQVMQEKGLMMRRVEINSLMKMGFYLGLNRMYKKLEDYDGGLRQNQMRMYYFPCLEGDSEMLTSQHLETVWAWLPHIYKPYDPQLIFPDEGLGYSLEGLTASWKERTDKPLLLIVRTTNHQIFGAFFEQNFRENDELFRGTPETFLFTLEPEAKCYRPTGANLQYVYLSPTMMLFGGGGDGSALQIDRELRRGSSHQSETFGNEPLSEAVDFRIDLIECFVLQ